MKMPKRRGVQIVSVLALAAIALAGGWWIYELTAREAPPAGVVTASGRIEAREVRVAAGTGGRLLRLLVREGEPVAQGQILAELDRRTPEATLYGARAGLAAAEAGVETADRRIAALESQLEMARLEARRYRRLYENDAAPRQAAERAEAAQAQLENETRGARSGRTLAERQVEGTRAQLRLAEIQLDETAVTAPLSGVVAEELVRGGEVVPAGAPLIVLRPSDEVRLNVYLALEEAERVRPGLETRVYTTALPGRFFTGRVARLASEAEFTPKDVHMPNERTTLVFAVEVRIPNPDGSLKDGFPADVYIRWDPRVPWPAGPPWQ